MTLLRVAVRARAILSAGVPARAPKRYSCAALRARRQVDHEIAACFTTLRPVASFLWFWPVVAFPQQPRPRRSTGLAAPAGLPPVPPRPPRCSPPSHPPPDRTRSPSCAPQLMGSRSSGPPCDGPAPSSAACGGRFHGLGALQRCARASVGRAAFSLRHCSHLGQRRILGRRRSPFLVRVGRCRRRVLRRSMLAFPSAFLSVNTLILSRRNRPPVVDPCSSSASTFNDLHNALG